MTGKANIYYPIAAVWVVADLISKRMIVPFLTNNGGSVPVIGNYLRFTLALNQGMAFGLKFGARSRIILIAFTLLTLGLIFHLYRQTNARHKLQVFALALITGGAIGNLIDRLTTARGVVDFIDVGVGAHRFWIFNVADSGVSVGGVLLVLTLWAASDEKGESREAEPIPPA